MTCIDIWVPGTPVAQSRPAVANRGGVSRVYYPNAKKLNPWKKAITAAAYEKIDHKFIDAVRCHMRFFMPLTQIQRHELKMKRVPETFPHTQRPDADNLAKPVLDALAAVAWTDDAQVHELTVHKCCSTHESGVLIWLEGRIHDSDVLGL